VQQFRKVFGLPEIKPAHPEQVEGYGNVSKLIIRNTRLVCSNQFTVIFVK